jgi:hypothetical protein
MRLSEKLAAVAALIVAFVPDAGAQRGVEVRFGFLDSADGSFVETTVVPNVEGQLFGWMATIPAGGAPVRWSEELTLPRPPREWRVPAGDPTVAISDDRKIALTRGTVDSGTGEFSHFWGVSAGDPPGIYTIVVKVSDGVVGEADLEFVDP